MKLRHLFVLVLAIAFTAGVCGSGFAADTAPAPTAPAAKPATPAAPTAPAAKDAPRTDSTKPAAKPGEPLVKCTVKGRVESKTVTNKKTGKEVKVFMLSVAEAKGDDGKPVESMKGKTLRIGGQKPDVLEKFVGKDAEIKGEANTKRIKAESIK
ncbi:MAG: hypothetical protein HZB26_19660 [Candidatus Hydrogenedentes bacterium]|nr:hypothetical protein [Candidatus Hydrogenedentota bacterium]